MPQPTGEKEPEQADIEKRRQPTEKEAHNEEAVVDCCGIEKGNEEGGMVDCCRSVERPNKKRMRRPTGEKEAEQADNEKRRQPTEKESHNEEAVLDCCVIEEGKEEGGMVDCCGSVEAEEADNETMTRPINKEEGIEEECECVEMPKSPPRQKREPAALK
jgi:hypothetical protein